LIGGGAVTERLADDLIRYDREHLWHPYASMANPIPAYPVASARGVRIVLEDGRELIDGMSSWWAAIHGYNHPVLNRALIDQLQNMAHVMFGGLTHGPAVDLAMLLADITPSSLEKVFFSDSGSVAVEVAIKMAFQYWQSLGTPERHRLLTIRCGYHGDTFGAMSVCDPERGMHNLFRSILPTHLFARAPRGGFEGPLDEDGLAEFARLLEEHGPNIAAVIMEPIVQGAGGMRFYHPLYLRKVRELTHQHGVLLILDEIATGFGRTGRLFASEWASISPDILCLGKALTGGYMTLAATMTTDRVAEGISSGNPGLFMHGPTFMANPLACSVAIASTRLLLSSPWRERVTAIQEHLTHALAPCRQFPHVADVRVLGAIGVVELHQPVDLERIQARFVKRGVWLRPFGNLVYAMPPYTIEGQDLEHLTRAMVETLWEEGRK
jgi:adenosylmethionine---8-amino-7-oxononanoate aminotransferase